MKIKIMLFEYYIIILVYIRILLILVKSFISIKYIYTSRIYALFICSKMFVEKIMKIKRNILYIQFYTLTSEMDIYIFIIKKK